MPIWFVFDGPGKAAAYINNLIYTCDDGTATTETGYAAVALIGSSPNPQFIVNGGIINRSAKVSTTIQSTGTYPVTNAVCKLDDVYIYTKREYIFDNDDKRGQYICAAGEHRCIDLAITNQMQYTVVGQSTSGDPYQYKAFAYIPVDTNTSQGCIHLTDGTNVDYKIYITKTKQIHRLILLHLTTVNLVNQFLMRLLVQARQLLGMLLTAKISYIMLRILKLLSCTASAMLQPNSLLACLDSSLVFLL